MFILVNHNQETGLGVIGRYATREDAANEIAKVIVGDYKVNIDMDRFITPHKHAGDVDFRYNDGNAIVWFNGYNCCCYDYLFEDNWIIIEVKGA
jgi:hypothetical protein|nr:MAG TPA: hypothetical protein [Caudoviricetes sp.]